MMGRQRRDLLLGMKVGRAAPASTAAVISAAWRHRWLRNRLQNADIMSQLRQCRPQGLVEALSPFSVSDQMNLALGA